jgi:hypothetical protein
MKKIIEKFDEEVTGIIKTGGYYKWDWKFPFRHFVKEELYFATGTSIWRYSPKPIKNK